MPRIFAVAALWGTAHAGPCTFDPNAVVVGQTTLTVDHIVYNSVSIAATCGVAPWETEHMAPADVEAANAVCGDGVADEDTCRNMADNAGNSLNCHYEQGEAACPATMSPGHVAGSLELEGIPDGITSIDLSGLATLDGRLKIDGGCRDGPVGCAGALDTIILPTGVTISEITIQGHPMLT